MINHLWACVKVQTMMEAYRAKSTPFMARKRGIERDAVIHNFLRNTLWNFIY